MVTKKNGFTLIELLAVIVILSVIALIATPIIMDLINNARRESFKSSSYGIIASAGNGFTKNLLKEDAIITEYTYVNGVETRVRGNIDLTYNGRKPDSGTVLIDKQGQIAIALYQDGYCAIKSYSENDITLEKIDENECLSTEVIVNEPLLALGMIPVKWNGTTWEDTTINDEEWYNYNTKTKKWANARTADGSMWVWIPRYIYNITNGWHSNEMGTIEIQFSVGTDDTRNNSVVLDTGTTANASNNKWTNHPAFTFGNEELTGIWVAKFEASGTSDAIDIKPNAVSLRNLTIGNIFTAVRNMEINNRYGWGTSSNNIDTHLTKNIEWGAIVYLTKSHYGKDVSVWKNNSSTFITGCAGGSIAAPAYAGCEYTYDTSNGQQASTTGNIYGIYDMSGGAYEYVSAYVNNNNINLTTYGTSILNADAKYKDVYAITTDTGLNNYNNTINKKGDAVYEISDSYIESRAWGNDTSYMPTTNNPWFWRGRFYNGVSISSGIFVFYHDTGYAHQNLGFRSILLVGEGL